MEPLTSVELAASTVGPVDAAHIDQDRVAVVHPGACFMHTSYTANELDTTRFTWFPLLARAEATYYP